MDLNQIFGPVFHLPPGTPHYLTDPRVSSPLTLEPIRYVTEADVEAWLATRAERQPDPGWYRFTTTEAGEVLQLFNPTTGAWHTLYIAGEPGDEAVLLGPAMHNPEDSTVAYSESPSSAYAYGPYGDGDYLGLGWEQLL